MYNIIKTTRKRRKILNKDKNTFGENDIEGFLNNAVNGSFSLPVSTFSESALSVVFNHTKRVMGTMIDYKELMMMYTCAMKEVQTKFDVLNTEFKVRYQRNPISSICTRLKRASGITEKLMRMKKPITTESIEENINDVAGVRVICSYIDDIYMIADALLRQDDITLVTRKDYIAEPKPNGYRSLHLIVRVPVFFADRRREMKVEVQIRTIAMDFWASLEHQLKYKQEIADQEHIIEQLKDCAEVINATDAKMLDIRRQIEEMADTPTEEDLLFEKFSRIDIPLE